MKDPNTLSEHSSTWVILKFEIASTTTITIQQLAVEVVDAVVKSSVSMGKDKQNGECAIWQHPLAAQQSVLHRHQ